MTLFRPAALDALEDAARAAGVAETRFRQTVADELLRLETERRRAHRRFHFLEALIAADQRTDDREASRAAQRAAAAEELGWDHVDARRAETLEALTPLADAVHDERLLLAAERAQAEQAAEEGGEPAAEPRAVPPAEARAEALLIALAAFEAQFETTRGTPFAELFDRYLPETPLVDF